MVGPLPVLTREQRLVGGIAILALLALAPHVAPCAASVLLIVVAQQPSAFRRLLRRAPLARLGNVSCSLHLAHVPVLVASMLLLHEEELPLWACLGVGVVSLAAAEVVPRIADAPARDLRRWADRRLRVSRPLASPPPRQTVEPLRTAESGLFHGSDRSH